jgi:large subunit ribosomal protein L30
LSVTKKQLQVTLKRSLNGRLDAHKACARGLGLRQIHHCVTVADTVENRGMINQIGYLVDVREL